MPRTDTRYNGWTNYATWRVNLEIFDGWETDAPMDGESCRDTVADFLDLEVQSPTIAGWVGAFLSDVDWQEIADHINEANDLTADADA